MGRFKPVIKTSTSTASSSVASPSDTTTSNKKIANTEVEALPDSTQQNTNNDTQIKVSDKQKTQKSVNNASTQKSKKTQKISDAGQVKKANTPRKKKTNKSDTATSSASTTSSEVSPETAKTTVTRKRKSKKEQQPKKATEPSNINPDVEETTEIVVNNESTQQPSPDTISTTVLESSMVNNQADAVVPVKTPRKRKNKVVNDTKKEEMNNNGNDANDGESVEQSKPKRVRKAKDPNAPKKPPNAYMQFSKIKRPEIKKENPDVNPKEILTLIGEAWRKMTEEEKKPYQDMVKIAMIEYEEQMKSYKGLCANSPIDNGQITMKTPEAFNQIHNNLNTQEIEQQNISIVPNETNQDLSRIMVCDGSQPDLSQLIVHQTLPSNVSFENYTSYGQRDDMETLLDMPDVGNSYEFQTNDPNLYNNSEQLLTQSTYDFQSTNPGSNNSQLYDNSAYQFPAAMLPLAMNIQENQDNHATYYYGDQQPPQVVKQDLLLYEPSIVQDNCEVSESGSSQELRSSPIIVKNREHDSGNLLLCQPFELQGLRSKPFL